MNYIERKKDVITNKEDLIPLYIFKDFPVFMGCTNEPEEKDLKADMVWVISKSSGLIQLKKLLPLEILYPESHGSGCIGKLWERHHEEFAGFISQFNPAKVFEIGGLHGILAKKYEKIKGKIDWTILEPNPAPIPGNNARFIRGFFDEKFQYSETFDAVVHSHLFEHMYEPDKFMKQLSDFMGEEKYLIFSVPNMKVMLERKYTNCINFEHTVLLSEYYVEHLLSKHKFRLVQKKYFLDDHSIFYAAIKDSAVKFKELPAGLFEDNKKLYQEYLAYHKNLISELNNKIKTTEKKVYLFGAHVFAQYLIAFGLDVNKVKCLLDNDFNKQNKRLYGTSLMVKSPKILKDENSPIVILKAGVYNKEIKKDIIENINPDVIFWE